MTGDDAPTRRRFLAALGTAGAGVAAGCLGDDRGRDLPFYDGTADAGTAWPSGDHDVANSRHAPRVTVPTDAPAPDWRSSAGVADEFPPVVAGDRVFAVGRTYLWAFDRSGRERWRFELGDEHVYGAPAVHPEGYYVAVTTLSGGLYVFSADDGELLNRRRFDDRTQAAPVVPGDSRRMFVSTERGHLHSISLAPNRWSLDWTHEAFGGVERAPAYGYSQVVLATTAGVEAVTDRGMGLWRTELPVQLSTRPVLSRGYVLVGSRDTLYALDYRTGALEWQTRIVPDDAAAGVDIAGIAATPDRVFVTDTRRLTVLELATGERRWRHHDREASFSRPTVVGNAVVVGSRDFLYAFHPAGGPGLGALRPDPVRWRYSFADGNGHEPAVADGRIYVPVSRAAGDVLVALA